MRKLLFGALVAGVALSAAPRVAAAFSDVVMVSVPFEFVVNGTVLPAGTYRINGDTQDSTLLYLTSLDGRRAVLLPALARTVNTASAVEVEFKQYGGQRYLWKVAVPGEDAVELAVPAGAGELAKTHAGGARPR